MQTMLGRVIRRTFSRLLLLAVVAIIFVATYVSLGRQFMPAVAGYSELLEDQIYSATGLAVTVESIEGRFEDFNPVLEINGLSLPVGSDQSGASKNNALVFDSALLEVNMWRSLWQRRWVLEEFSVDQLRIDLVQSDSGQWQVAGMGSAGLQPVGIEALFSSLQRVYRLDLYNVAVRMRNRFGEEFSFGNGSAVIQNRGQAHFIHFDSNLQGNSQPLQLSLELRGDKLQNIEGAIHLRIPHADYSQVLRSFEVEGYSSGRFVGGGQLWLALQQGRAQTVVADLEVPVLTVKAPADGLLLLNDLAGKLKLERNPEGWSFAIAEANLRHEEQSWQEFNAFFDLVENQAINIRADNLDLSFLAAVALDSGLLNAAAIEQLTAYAPVGNIRNLQATLPVGDNSSVDLSLVANLDNVRLDAVKGAPSIQGINGFLQFGQSAGSSLLGGMVEVESRQLELQIPDLFLDIWQYDYVNGRLRFEVDNSDGQRVTLVSDEIFAQSEAVDGWVKFTSMQHRLSDGERDGELELMVGARSVGATAKSFYLPDGPRIDEGLANTLQYLERSIISGDVYDSAVLFRGKTGPVADAAVKTFQSVFHVRDGEFEFSPEWPVLDSLSAQVITDDDNIDISASSGGSLDLSLHRTTARIRKEANDENWLRIDGEASGLTDAGLHYLQEAPLGDNLKNTFARWRVDGEFSASIGIDIPLHRAADRPDLRLQLQLLENELDIAEFELKLESINGPIIFDTETGLESTSLTGRLFDRNIAVDLSSTQDSTGNLAAINVQASGSVTPQRLASWPGQTGIARVLLEHMSGEFSYLADLTIGQSAQEEFPSSLKIRSDLSGVTSSLPVPFAKPAVASLPLALQIDFGGEQQRLIADLGEQLNVELNLEGDGIRDGLILLGDTTGRRSQPSSERSGLVIRAALGRLDFEPWLALVEEFQVENGNSDDFAGSLALIDISSELFTAFGQEFEGLDILLEPDTAAGVWRAGIDSEAIQGDVLIPFGQEDYLELDFERIYLAGETMRPPVAGTANAAERIDPLAGLDPRELPPMQVNTAALRIGERDFGSWQFTLDPTEQGAQVSDLAVDFRGLRLGLDEPDASIEQLSSGFNWYYDGDQHTSALTGVLSADNLGDVLLASGVAASLISEEAVFVTDIEWAGSPAFVSSSTLSGRIDLRIRDGRFLQESNGGGALKLVSIINFSALVRRLRFSDDLMRRGLAFDDISGQLRLDDGLVSIEDRLVISGPSSLYQFTGQVDLAEETVDAEMYVTLPISDNIPWLGLLTANIPLAVGAYLVGQIFGDQVDSLTSAVYTLQGPWEGLQPEFKQAFGSPESAPQADATGTPTQR